MELKNSYRENNGGNVTVTHNTFLLPEKHRDMALREQIIMKILDRTDLTKHDINNLIRLAEESENFILNGKREATTSKEEWITR